MKSFGESYNEATALNGDPEKKEEKKEEEKHEHYSCDKGYTFVEEINEATEPGITDCVIIFP